jgi:hypothetical protein
MWGTGRKAAERTPAVLLTFRRQAKMSGPGCVNFTDPGAVPDQPALGDRDPNTCSVFVSTPASAQEWQVISSRCENSNRGMA